MAAKFINQEIEEVEWILNNRNLGVAERNALEIYVWERRQQTFILKDICQEQGIKWFEDTSKIKEWIYG